MFKTYNKIVQAQRSGHHFNLLTTTTIVYCYAIVSVINSFVWQSGRESVNDINVLFTKWEINNF